MALPVALYSNATVSWSARSSVLLDVRIYTEISAMALKGMCARVHKHGTVPAAEQCIE